MMQWICGLPCNGATFDAAHCTNEAATTTWITAAMIVLTPRYPATAYP